MAKETPMELLCPLVGIRAMDLVNNPEFGCVPVQYVHWVKDLMDQEAAYLEFPAAEAYERGMLWQFAGNLGYHIVTQAPGELLRLFMSPGDAIGVLKLRQDRRQAKTG